jgi:hypothetical protein
LEPNGVDGGHQPLHNAKVLMNHLMAIRTWDFRVRHGNIKNGARMGWNGIKIDRWKDREID